MILTLELQSDPLTEAYNPEFRLMNDSILHIASLHKKYNFL